MSMPFSGTASTATYPSTSYWKRAAELGVAHEDRLVDQYRTELGDHAVQEIGKPTAWDFLTRCAPVSIRPS